ncbi:hypothetical protein N0V95_002476 [Ascochyta clinopodiicola]|nr:hypothetical protein N0V95_002476 [Ascochyta clinopodiicola]
MYRLSPRHAPTVPASPAYRTPAVSSESGHGDNYGYGYDYDYEYGDRSSATLADHARRPAMSRRPSSNILGNTSGGTTRRGSDNSSASYRLQPQTSNSTMRSHYDAKASPLSISQQTSNSAVRDMALRRGKPQVGTDARGYQASPLSPMMDAGKREHRKSKPARLDLSKLFPKPKTGNGNNYSNQLLSPAKMVNSPAAMSMNSEYFAQPMTREPTPGPKGHAKLTQHATRRHAEHAPMPTSPKRIFKRDDFDNAKVHVRRPPKGVQHWFDALDEDSDEAQEEARAPMYAPQARPPSNTTKSPLRRTSFSGIYPETATSHPAPRTQKSVPGFNSDSFSHEDIIDIQGLTSPSQFSLHTQNSTKTKESTLSKRNLQDSSCLSFSSSEDELDDDRHVMRNFAVRNSLNMDDDAGEIVFGQAQAFEVRSNRMPFERKLSIMSTSTNAATIDIMYTPEPVFPPNFSRLGSYSGSRRSSHFRQPSIILEDEDDRPRTAAHAPPSSSAYSTHSMRTSVSEPQPRSQATDRKMMSVTPEEEALLELMRKKRASMAKQSSTSMSKAYIEQEDERRKAVESLQKTGRSSTFATETPVVSPVRVVEMKSRRKSLAASSSSSLHLTPPPRGRPAKTNHDAHMFSTLRDSSVSDNESFSFPVARGSLPHHLPAPGALSPLDPFPPISPSHTASLTSPTTIDHVSPLPSPVTPGLRIGGTHDIVKIASSDTSADSEDIAILETDLPVHIIKAAKSVEALESNHQRRRTASSGADMSFPVPPSFGAKELAAVSEASISSRAPSIVEPTCPLPALPERSAPRQNALKMALEQRSRQSSVVSNASSRSNASSMNVSGLLTGRERSRHASRGSSVASMTRSKARNSVSDDVLAAWGSLGGTY